MGRQRLGILYLAPWLTIGGSDRNTIDWFRWIDRERFRVYLVTTQESRNELFEEAAQTADGAWALPEIMPGSAMPRFIADLIDAEGIDVVHAMNSRLGYDLLPSLRRAFPHLRTVAQLHAEEHPAGTGYPRYVATRSPAAVDAYSVISEFLQHRLMEYGVTADRVHILGLGVDTDRFDPERVEPEPLPRDAHQFHILFPARLAWQKNPLLVVEIAVRLREAGSNAVIHSVGDGELRAEMESAINRQGITDRVVVHGHALEMPRWYAATDVTLLPSRYEGIPLTIYESMAMAKPVVAADVGAISELVDSSMGFLIPETEDPDAFVRALLRLESDPQLRREMGQAARARACAEFPVTRVADAHADLYQGLVESAPPQRGTPDLTSFDDWWADDTEALSLAVAIEPSPRAWLSVGSAPPPGAAAAVLVGRIITKPLPGATALDLGGSVEAFAWTAPLPGMVDLQTVLPGHLAGLWASVGNGPPPTLSLDLDGPAWVDAPYLLPETGPSAAVPEKRRRPVRAAFRSLRGR